MPENEDAMDLWLTVQTQWRAGGMGIVGLDYAEVRVWAEELGIAMTPAMWGKIRKLERQTLAVSHANKDDSTGCSHVTKASQGGKKKKRKSS
jgi:hypothetical protein